MPSKEFAQPVRGSGAEPIATTATSAFEVDNYNEGGRIEVGSGNTTSQGAYPVTIDPAEDIQYLVITETGTDIRVDITTVSGTNLTDVMLRGAGLTLDPLQIADVTFKDPNGTGAATYGLWVGES